MRQGALPVCAEKGDSVPQALSPREYSQEHPEWLLAWLLQTVPPWAVSPTCGDGARV